MTAPTVRATHHAYVASLTDDDLNGLPDEPVREAGPGFTFTNIPRPADLLEIVWQSEDDAPPMIREGNEPPPGAWGVP